MARKRKYDPNTRWHKTPDGDVRKCYAVTRPCPYLLHFDSQEEANDPRQRAALYADQEKEVIYFKSVIDDNPNENNLRKTSEEARSKFFKNGLRPCAPLGEIEIPLPNNQKIMLKRETFDIKQTTSDLRIGARYVLRYFENDDTYTQHNLPLNTFDNFKFLDDAVNKSITNSVSLGDGEEEVEAKLVDRYEKVMQTVSELEVMARGADKAYHDLKIDLFDASKPGELKIDSGYSNSVIQPYDIVDSLKVHSAIDTTPKEVIIHFSDTIRKGDGSKWSIDRQGDGSWYVGADSTVAVVSEKHETAETATTALRTILEAYEEPEYSIQEKTRFLEQLMNEVEPAIKSYEQTVSHRMKKPQVIDEKPTEKKSFADKMFNIFS